MWPHRATPRVLWLLPLLAGALGLAGYFGPWVPHRAAGLVITGLDLGEYVKFLPGVAGGQIAIRREVFYLPLVATSAGATLLAGRRTLVPGWGRILLAVAAIPVALAMLPPAWTPATLLLSEFRLQTAAIAVCLLLVPGVAVTRHLPRWLALGLIALLAVAAAIAPASAFLRVLPAIRDLYRQPLQPGWGYFAAIAGYLLLAVISLALALHRPTRPDQPVH